MVRLEYLTSLFCPDVSYLLGHVVQPEASARLGVTSDEKYNTLYCVYVWVPGNIGAMPLDQERDRDLIVPHV